MNLLKRLVVALFFFSGYAEAEETPVHPLSGMRDEGKLTYYMNEEYVGSARCVWREDGSFENNSIIKLGRQRMQSALKIFVDNQGLWIAIEMNTAQGPAKIVRNGTTVTISLKGKEHDLELEPGSFIMDDMSPSLMSQAVAAYDHETGGKQGFPLLFLPIMTMDASLEYLETFERIVEGKLETFRKYHYIMAPVYDVYVIVDEANRVCLADYPVQHGLFIREGFDTLNVQDESDVLLSRPEFKVIEERGVGVPMRDGVELATDLYRPAKEGKSPVILVRTPYRKEMVEWKARFYARRGYVFAVQDVRGRFSSPGEWKPFIHEADDGHDAVEWLAKQPFSSGKVGMIGGSYLGWTQWWAASRRSPHLATIIPNVAPPVPYFNFPHECGALMLATSLWWTNVVMEEATASLSGMGIAESFELVEDQEKFKHLPVIELDEKILGKKIEQWREWVTHPDYDAYWRKLDYLQFMKDFDLPVYHQSGWFDGDGIGSKLNHAGMTGFGHRCQKLVLGPWGHTDTDTRFLRDRIDFGPKAIVDLQKSYLRWMDRWLKGIENGMDKEPMVSLFVMGRNDWLHGNTYPLEGTQMTKFYLASNGDAETFDGKGWLTTEPPRGEGGSTDSYTYDPGDPTGPNPRDRKDILVYRTPPLEESMTIAGPLSAVLYASTSAKDTDWVVRVAKVYDGEKVLLLGKGIIRARYRDSFSAPELLTPGKVYEYHLDLWQTGLTLDKGEQLSVVVSSALFPQFSRNLNTGGHNEMDTEYEVAEQTVYHSEEYPSHIVLPVIPDPWAGK